MGSAALTEYLSSLHSLDPSVIHLARPNFVDPFVLTLALSKHERVYSRSEIRELRDHYVYFSQMIWGKVSITSEGILNNINEVALDQTLYHRG